MMSKRAIIIPDIYKQRKKVCCTSDSICGSKNGKSPGSSGVAIPSNTESALILLRSYFPVEKFAERLPAIILKHQLYSLIKNKTLVDKELNDLRLNGSIRFFHLGAEADDICIVFNEDFKIHTDKIAIENAVVAKFLVTLLNNYSDLSISKEALLKDYISKEEDITELMKVGLLTVRDIGSWWHSIPRAGEFMKSYIRGRKAIILMIKKSKYSEILQKELETRKLPKVAKLGILYHIHDITGAELVTCITTTSGRLLRLKE